MKPVVTKESWPTIRHWLGCGFLGCLLAAWPWDDGMSLTGSYYKLGLLVPMASIKIGVMDNVSPSAVHVFGGAAVVLGSLLWTVAIHQVAKLRDWARKSPTWLGASIQAAWATLTVALVAGFLFAAAPLANDLLLQSAGWSEVEKIYQWEIQWVPIAWIAVPLIAATTVLLDGRNREGWRRSCHAVASGLFIAALLVSLPLLEWQIGQFRELAGIAKSERLKPPSNND